MDGDIQHNFQFYIKDIRFHYGGISFTHFVQQVNKRLEFTIINYHIREEFDSVREYFANIFNSKKIDVIAIISTTNDGNFVINAHSPQIESIDENVLQKIKLDWTRDVTSRRSPLHSSNPLTIDQFFETLPETDFQFSSLYSNEQEWFNDLISVSQSRHLDQLRYLAQRHLFQLMRLRFVLKPFSFLFLLEGRSRYLLIWETLDTEEATYIWPIEKDTHALKLSMVNLQATLSLIAAQGKQAYQRSSGNQLIRVLHHYKNGIKGFIDWKDELETILSV